ncbi:MAG: hypothetical protein ABI837_03455 [Acidobacteriota bacterium]
MKAIPVVVALLVATSSFAQEQLRVAQPNQPVTTAQFHAGEPVNGFPNWAERVVHEWVNRARVDPQTEMTNCGAACAERACYIATAPLSWNESLNRAARFHSDEMVKQKYFTHDSRCTVTDGVVNLYPAGCDGSAACACAGGVSTCGPTGCTTWNARVGMFGASPAGAIIVATGDPNDSFNLWLNEPAATNACGFTQQNGHRWLILTAQGAFGAGAAGKTVGEFGYGEAPYRIPSGSHYPQQADSVQMWANWYDAKAPRSAAAVIDGKCTSMFLKRGTATNGAWNATATGVGAGCHRYYFSFIDTSGVEVTYPSSGSLGIGSDSSCADWAGSRLNGSCSSSSPASPVSSKRRSVRH